jgi:chromosome segregation protein
LGAQIESRREAARDLGARVVLNDEAATRVAAEEAEVAAAVERERAAAEITHTGLETVREARARIDLERGELRRRIEAAEVDLDTVRAELHRTRSRLQSLLEIQQRYRGCSSGVQALMAHRDPSEAAAGIMADYLRAPAHLESAVAAVLGDRLQGVVVDAPSAAVRGVELLKELQEGRSAFLPRAIRGLEAEDLTAGAAAPRALGWRDPAAPASASVASGIEVVDLSAESGSGTREPGPEAPRRVPAGVLGRLSDLIEIDGQVGALGRTLVGRATVVDSLPRALELWQTGELGEDILVTLDGDRVEPSGVIVGGSPTALDSALLQQKREIEELQRLQAELEGAFEASRARLLGLGERRAELDRERERRDVEWVEHEQARTLHAERAQQGAERLSRLSGEHQRAVAEGRELAQQATLRRAEAEELRAAVGHLEAERPGRASRLAQLED